MDQRAERAVHNQLVEVTCNENSAQTFLITPKLLPGLRYDKHIKILCINNVSFHVLGVFLCTGRD
jgi:chromosome segregation ATPase